MREFVRVDDAEWSLLAGWLVAAMRPRGPFPMLVFVGEQGSAKSTSARLTREVVDPSAAALRSEPREMRDLAIAASNSWVVCLDNVSGVAPWLSDALCRISTGGGYATRELYSDAEETILDVQRPVVMTAIEDVVNRADLLDRAVVIRLLPIPESERRSERELEAAWERARPRILGAACDAVVLAMQRLPQVEREMTSRPRMADFACWAEAAEPAFNVPAGTFRAAYARSRREAHAVALEGSLIAEPIRALVASEPPWEGSAQALLDALTSHVDERVAKQRDWPKSPRALSGMLRRLAPSLRATGIDVGLGEKATDRKRTRLVRLARRAESKATGPSASSAPSETLINQGSECGRSADDADASIVPGDSIVRSAKPYRTGIPDEADDADGKKRLSSALSPCGFFTGPTEGSCSRCGVEWAEHQRPRR